jgi:hypothetical protein
MGEMEKVGEGIATDPTFIAQNTKFRDRNGSVGITTSLGLVDSGFELRYR